MNEEMLFIEAMEIREATARAQYLNKACAGDAAVRARIERLLDEHRRAGSFLDHPAVAPDVTRTLDPSPEREKAALTGEYAGTQIGPYKLLQQIGEGGMGTVFMAEQTEPFRRTVALKVIKTGMDSAQIIARFEAERQAVALMDHPNIAKVFDAGTTDDGRPYFVMELVKGVPITTFCDENLLTPRDRLALFVQVCAAVQHAHQKGIIHRDLKPSNVLVALYDDRPVPKVIDFGVAKATGERLTERTMFTAFGALVGTLQYMSPEQARFNALDIDTRSDVYSLGVLMYELLTGSTPLEGAHLKRAALDDLLRRIREEEPPRPSTRLSQSGGARPALSAQRGTTPDRLGKVLRGELDWIVMKALEKDRIRRYETASGMARDVEHYLADEPVEACPPSARYRMHKFARRYRVPLAVTTGLVAFLLATAAFSTWQAVRATRAEGVARDAERQATDERDRAVDAERRAGAERANAQGALGFLQKDVFEYADPAREPDRDLKVRALLDRAAKRLNNRQDMPDVVVASIRQTIGKAYLGLGEMPNAEQQLETSYAMWQKLAGLEDERTLDAANNLAILYFLQSRFEKAEPLLHLVIAGRRHLLGPDAPGTLEAIHCLGALYMFREEYDRVVELLAGPLAAARRQRGDEHNPATIRLMRILGYAYCELRRDAEGEPLLVEAVARGRAVLPAKHPDTQVQVTMLAELRLRQGRLAEAEELANGAYRVRTEVLGDGDIGTLMSQSVLVSVYLTQGRAADASSLANDLLAKADTKRRDRLPAFFIERVGDLGRDLSRHGDATNAEIALRLYLEVAEKNLPDGWRRAVARSTLGGCLLRQQQYAVSEPLLLEGYAGLRRYEAKIPAHERREHLVEALKPLVALYTAWRKLDQATKWQKELTVASEPDPKSR